MQESDAKSILELDEHQLLVGLGHIVSTKLSAKPEDEDETIKEANKWLSENLKKLKTQICGNEKVQRILQNKEIVDDTGLLIAVFSLLSGIFEPAIAALVSGLVVRRGLSSICVVT